MSIYIYIYIDLSVCVTVCVFVDRYLNQNDFYLQHLWTASNCLKDVSLRGLLIRGLRAKIDKELCSRESTEFERENT